MIFSNFFQVEQETSIFFLFRGKPKDNYGKQVDILMKDKVNTLNAGFILNMPGNYIVMYGAKSEKNQIRFENEKVKVQQIVDIIKEKKNYGYKKSNILIDKVVGPLFYKKMSSVHSMDKLFVAKDNCTGCGVCEKVCAVKNIEIKNGKPSWKNNCEQCMACIQYCPVEAIEYGDKTIGRKRYKNPNISLKEMINE